MESIGWTITNPALLTQQAHMVCNEGLAHGVSVREMSTTLMKQGYSSRDASALINNAIRVYCPKYAAAGAGSTSSADNDRNDTFVEILKQEWGITMDHDAAADIASVACKAPIAGVGHYRTLQALQQRYPRYSINTVGTAMGAAVVAYCPERMP
ncbi:hypothetical protein AU198_20810 [Mycobacterium sp. GA-1199]|nr:hypothetical protein AU198_20810 [Mycobacterium sp. GA-1199]